ncbi:MAG TPA: family 10 glycosylhydrolase [Thermotogota bacterium]|nr:family 10 glycosylhydrolase [Thermotogota bacterium]HOD91051.1 family 10 glycosylhydrolase [Thermotogota bacterium]HOF23599.1 family 10 glycosylhydrolase [Thermotogota bacterium]HOH12445.1 family 10 glycosylhydrolase [Thermotogota bacterium]HOM55412.1 family 10 glycosylhydrolase [Thermotogota bacterium]
MMTVARKRAFLISIAICFFFIVCWGAYPLGVRANRLDLISEQSLDQLLGMCIQFRVDTLYVPIVSYMEALYLSDQLPRSNVLINNHAPDSFDPLRYLMEKGRHLGVAIIPIVDLFTVWPSKDFPAARKHVSRQHPEWLSMDSLGRVLTAPAVLDPGVPEAQSFLITLLKEILIRYNPLILAFENFGYPSPVYGYNPYAMKEFEIAKNHSYARPYTMDDFRADALTSLLIRFNALRDGLGVRTRFLLLTETNPDRGLREHFQDWVLWLNSGYFGNVALWYWFMDVKTVRYDTLQAFDILANDGFIVGFSPLSLIRAQLDLVLQEILTHPVGGIMIDTFSPEALTLLNLNGIGLPR